MYRLLLVLTVSSLVACTNDGAPAADTDTDTDTDTDAEPSARCVYYCDLFLENCDGVSGVQAYDGEEDCLAACAPWPEGTAGAFQGATLECRIAHLDYSAGNDQDWALHCTHAQEEPMGQCL